jgi:hypothetical protein
MSEINDSTSYFSRQSPIVWGNLSRLNNLLIAINISLFFLSGLVAQGYYYTFYSIALLIAVSILTLIPGPHLSRLWFYVLCLLVEFSGLYFLIASVVYWVRSGSQLSSGL